MGQDEVEPSDHSPSHTVTEDSYWIFRAEVTNRMYRACVELGVCTEPVQSPWYTDAGYENAPVSGVTWDQAKGYCEWIGGRLPTEAEWELAARGTDARPYPWGEDEPTCNLLNFKDCLDPSEPNGVGSYPLGVSPFKMADMAGNVSEWVSDWYAEDYYANSPANDPTGPATGEDSRASRPSASAAWSNLTHSGTHPCATWWATNPFGIPHSPRGRPPRGKQRTWASTALRATTP
jgi:iron(II)-dependent oxidoreductase